MKKLLGFAALTLLASFLLNSLACRGPIVVTPIAPYTPTMTPDIPVTIYFTPVYSPTTGTTPGATISPTAPVTYTPTPYPTLPVTLTHSPTPLATFTFTLTGSPTPLPTQTMTFTGSPTAIATLPLTITATWTPTPLVSTPTYTPAASVTFSPTPCQTYAPWGETVLGSSSVTYTGGTVLQAYTFNHAVKIQNLQLAGTSASAGASIQMGIYNDAAGVPGTILFLGNNRATAFSGYWMSGVPIGGISLAPGTYWFAFAVTSGSVAIQSSPGSAAFRTVIPGIMPPSISMATAVPNPPAPSGQSYMSGYFSDCP